MPGTYHLDQRSSPVTLPPLQSILNPTEQPYDPLRPRELLKEPPSRVNGYHTPQSYYSSPQYPPNGASLPRSSYPSAPPPSVTTAPPPPLPLLSSNQTQTLPYLNAPYVPPRENTIPLPSTRPASQQPPLPAYSLPALNSSLKASAINNGPSNGASSIYPRASVDNLEKASLDSRGPTRPISNEQLRSDPHGAGRNLANARNVLEVREVPGEGECFVLEDGSLMRTVIAGERVNPAWGITKAGKPRKRLAKACATCREKKIKCEQGGPGDTKCVQCARLNRPCKIPQETPGQNEPEQHKPVKRPAPSNGLGGARFGPPSRGDSFARQRYDSAMPHQTLNGYGTVSVERLGSQGKPFDEDHYTGSYQDLQESQAAALARKKGRQSTKGRKFQQPRLPESANAEKFHPKIDPYEADPETTMYFLDLFFRHRNASPYVIWPRDHFFSWTRDCKEKSADDIMVLYSIMAFGSAFSLDGSGREIGEKCYQVAYSLERDRVDQPSLQLMQARSALLLYNFARGNFEGTFEYTAHAIRTATSMRYTDENRVSDIDEAKKVYEFGMNAAQIKECRRRSFYITYFIDRYNSFSYGSMGQIHDIELFLHLPTHERDYEAGNEVTTAAFGGEEVREAHVAEPSPMALLVEITSIWGDVTGNSYRSVNRVPAIYVSYYEDYFRRTRERMRGWVDSLPERLRYSKTNINRALQEGYFTDFYVLQAIYHLVGMKLGRTGRVDILPDEIKRRNLRMTRCYASRFLRIIHVLAQQIYKAPNDDIDLALSQPFPGYVILNACDVISAGGRMSDLNTMTNCQLNDAKQVLEQGSKFWAVNQKQCRAIDDRQGYLSALGMNGGNDTEKMRVDNAIDRSFLPENHDLVYKVEDKLFWDVVLSPENDEQDPLTF